MASSNPLTLRYPNKRRTPRIALSMKVGVSGMDRLGQKFSTNAKATNLNLYGGSIVLAEKLDVGATVVVRNLQKLEAKAKVISHSGAKPGMHNYGIQFTDDAAGFWGIHFPIDAAKARA